MDCIYNFCRCYSFVDFSLIFIDSDMNCFSDTSSSEEEAVQEQSNQLGFGDGLAKPLTASTPAIGKNKITPKNGGSVRSGGLKRMLALIVEAVQKSPTGNEEKGISIYRIKQYLKKEHHIRKKEIQELLRPTLEAAIEQKKIIKTTVLTSVLQGSVKLNPAFAKVAKQAKKQETDDDPSSSAEELAVDEIVVESRKRKAGRDEDAEGSNKRRIRVA